MRGLGEWKSSCIMVGELDQGIKYPRYKNLLCDWQKDMGYVIYVNIFFFNARIALEANSNVDLQHLSIFQKPWLVFFYLL